MKLKRVATLFSISQHYYCWHLPDTSTFLGQRSSLKKKYTFNTKHKMCPCKQKANTVLIQELL